jgi:integrase
VDVVVEHADGRIERVKKVAPVQSRRGAQAYERELREALLSGRRAKEVAKAAVPTVAEFEKEFLDTYAKVNNKPSEVAAKTSHLKVHLLPFFGKMKLDAITPRDIERYKAAKLTGEKAQSPKSINNHLTVLRRMLGVAVDWGLIEKVPKMKPMRAPKPKFDFLTFEEADRLVAAAEEPWKTEVIVALRTGLRHGELHGLRWGDVDLVAGRLVVRRTLWRKQFGTPKSGKEREVPLSDETIAALKHHRAQQRVRSVGDDLVFSTDDGKFLLATACKWPLWRACKRAGLRPIQWHVLRHTFASHLVMRNAPIKAVQELMGHSTIEMTMRYAHLSPAAKRDAVMLLDRKHGHGHQAATQLNQGGGGP